MFKVRLFAGDTMVEQLFFTTDNPDLLRYQAYAYGADFAPTTENGMPVAVPYSFFEGEVTLHAAHPWDHVGSVSARLTPDGPGVRSNGEDIGTWDVLVLMADPAPLTGCQSGPVPADAEALAERIQSDSDLEWTAPVAVSAGGTEALMMDVAFADYTDAGTCDVDGVAVADVPGAVVVKDIGLTMGDWGPMDVVVLRARAGRPELDLRCRWDAHTDAALPVRRARGVVPADPGDCDRCAGAGLIERWRQRRRSSTPSSSTRHNGAGT